MQMIQRTRAVRRNIRHANFQSSSPPNLPISHRHRRVAQGICDGHRIVDMRNFPLGAVSTALMIVGYAGPMTAVQLSAPPPATTAFDGSYRTAISYVRTSSVSQG